MVLWVEKITRDDFGMGIMEETQKTLDYKIISEKASDKAYDEVCRYLGDACHHMKLIEGKTYYFFDKEETKAARTDGKRIEVGDLVENDIIDSIKHILNSEKRGSDVLKYSI